MGFIGNFGDGTLSILDLANGIVQHTVPVGAGPWGIAVYPHGT